MTKITKRAMFEALKALADSGAMPMSGDISCEMVSDFCAKEIDALDRKAAKAKETAAKKKAENDELTLAVLGALSDSEYMTIADVTEVVDFPDSTVAKVSYRLTKLFKDGMVEKSDVEVAGSDGSKKRKLVAYRKLS